MSKHLKLWWQLAIMNFESQYGSGSRLNTFLLISGKLIRLGFVILFIASLFNHTSSVAGYSLYQTLLFFMTFNLIDITAQFFFRGIYLVRPLVREGNLDGILLKPVNSLFRLASHMVDFLDLLTLIPTIGILIVIILHLENPITLSSISLYLLLSFSGLIIAMAIHILVAALAVATQEIDNEIWIYRDLMTMGRFPVDIYSAPIQFILTFIIPIAVMISFPAKAMMGLLSEKWILIAFIIAGVFLITALKFWNFSLKHYTSVSS